MILPEQGVQKKKPGKGSNKPLRAVTQEYRDSLSRQVTAIKESSNAQLTATEVIPVKVKVMKRAVAKSHRPNSLFSDATCPIIGAGKSGELFVRATSEGLEKLNKAITSISTKEIIKALSAVDAIEPVTNSFRLHGMKAEEILQKSPKKEDGYVTKARLFNFDSEIYQAKVVAEFQKKCDELNIAYSSNGYSPGSYTYELKCDQADQIKELSNYIGIRSISHMPLIKMIRPKAINLKPYPDLPERADSNTDIPIVVVVDSGISKDNKVLNSWVVGRIADVAPEYSNPFHGTFVAGLICWGSQLNPTVPGIDSNPCGVFDLQVIPNDDPEVGDTSNLTESELLISLESALRQYSDKYKVWNLSLGSDSVCSLDEFSTLAEELDNLQETYQVSFVISAGNYGTRPLLDYPRAKHHEDTGRITSPADSVLGITVGSVSHVDYQTKGPKIHNPSPFSRHGAGPNYIIKPDLIHYGGSCNIDGDHVTGIRSIVANGTAEDLGTSFSAPLVSRTLAQIYHQIIPTPTPVLSRALLTHHAVDPRNGSRIPDGEENFFGFGLPTPLPYCLECTPHSATLVFEDSLRSGFFLEWDDFPFPPSLRRNGKYYGHVSMTIAFAPSRGPRWGSEYCESHIEANFGVYFQQVSRTTGESQLKFRGLVPPEHKNPSLLYETYQIETLRKWSPVRTYFGDLGEKGERGERWRLKVSLLTRHGISVIKPQPFSLIVTISDPEKTAPVYDEMAQLIRNKYRSNNLSVRGATQVQNPR